MTERTVGPRVLTSIVLPSDRISALELLESLSIEQLDELIDKCLILYGAAWFARYMAPPPEGQVVTEHR